MKNIVKPTIGFCLIVLSLAANSACKKKKEELENKAYPETVQVGGYSIFDYTNMEPTSLIGTTQGSISSYFEITGDSVRDFKVTATNTDLEGDLWNGGHTNASLTIQTLNPDCYIVTDSAGYIIPLGGEDYISLSDHWNQGVLTLLNRTYTCCPATPHVYQGLWENKSGHVVGIRYKNRLGYLRLELINNCYFKLYGYGLSKLQ